ncbi:MAG: hypothetical protein M1556_06910 [Candidatus Thermoplasmatota archaeon]|nr:hypothetical protein [Candidatus Thermoplasmatota archaeon]
MYMKNEVRDREFDGRIEGRMKRLDRINLKEELDFMDNVSELSSPDGREVLGE